MRADLDYSTGLYPPEGDPPFQWTRQRAVFVVPVEKRWMALTVLVNHPDVGQKPVEVKVWADRKLRLSTRLSSSEPVTEYIPAGDGEKRMMLETWVNRTAHPSDFGSNDQRELGLWVRWTFVDVPPPNATIARH